MVTDPITLSSTSVGRPLSLMNVFRYRPRLSPARDVPLTISHGRLTDEGIIMVRLTAGGHFRVEEKPAPHQRDDPGCFLIIPDLSKNSRGQSGGKIILDPLHNKAGIIQVSEFIFSCRLSAKGCIKRFRVLDCPLNSVKGTGYKAKHHEHIISNDERCHDTILPC